MIYSTTNKYEVTFVSVHIIHQKCMALRNVLQTEVHMKLIQTTSVFLLPFLLPPINFMTCTYTTFQNCGVGKIFYIF